MNLTLHDLVMVGQTAYNQAYSGNTTEQGYAAERARVQAILYAIADEVAPKRGLPGDGCIQRGTWLAEARISQLLLDIANCVEVGEVE